MTRLTCAVVAAMLALPAASALGATFEEGMALKGEEKFDEAIVVFRELVRNDPEHVDALQQLATLLGWTEQYAESIATWRQAIEHAPDYMDLRLGLARVLYWDGQHAAAAEQLDALLLQEPGRIDATMLRGDVAMAAGDVPSARFAYRRALAIEPENEAATTKLAAAVEPPRWRADIGISFDSISNEDENGRGLEHAQAVQFGYTFSPELTFATGFRQLRRFNRTDWRFNAELWLTPIPELSLQLRFEDTPRADFSADYEGTLRGSVNLDALFTPLFELRVMDFATDDLLILGGGVRSRIDVLTLEFRYARTFSEANADTDVFLGRIALDLDDVSVWLLGSHGDEAVPPLALAKVTVLSGGALWNICSHVGIRVDITYEDRQDAYVRWGVNLGTTLRL